MPILPSLSPVCFFSATKNNSSMAVEAHQHQHHHFPVQLLGNREKISVETNNEFNINMGFGIPISLAEAMQLNPGGTNLLTLNNSDLIPAMNTAVFSDRESGLTCNNNFSGSRKRARDCNNSDNPLILNNVPAENLPQKYRNPVTHLSSFAPSNDIFSFLGEDISVYIQQQQLEIDRFINLHTEKVRAELEEKRRGYSKRLYAAVEEGMMKRLKAKEEEIEKIGKMNCFLEERVRSLCMENQIWQNLARANEATAKALRNDLEQVLAQAKEERHGDVAEDAESCCNSNNGDREIGEEVEKQGENGIDSKMVKNSGNYRVMEMERCRNCRNNSSCVLLLPCRHLCLCTPCSARLHTCPICKSIKNASVHVNLS